MSWGYEAEAGRTWIEKEYKKFMTEQKKDWKVGDRVRLAGVEGKVSFMGDMGLTIKWDNHNESNVFYYDNPLFEKLERVAAPKPLPELEAFIRTGQCLNRLHFRCVYEKPTPEIVEALERDVAKLREYLGEAAPAPAPEKREIKWPTLEELNKALDAKPTAQYWGPTMWAGWLCKWFREQIEGQL